MDDPFLPPDAPIMKVADYINIVLTAFFVAECVFKVLSFGLFFYSGAYLRDPWNILDFSIAIVSLLSHTLQGDRVQFLSVLRLLRALRPLRLVTRFNGLKTVLYSLIWSIPSIINVILVTVLAFIIFGIMGVQLMEGTFHSCSHPMWSNKVLCEKYGYAWESLSVYNFDNIISAILTLFTMQTFEGWVNILMMGIDSTEPGWVGIRENRPYMALYFIIYIVVGVFFISNLFVGVLIDQYYNMKSMKNFHGLLTPKQKRWIDVQRVLLDAKPRWKPKRPTPRRLPSELVLTYG